ncbi:hypothetical protein [Haliangium sp.]|uniref:hypothetical protein n=1 Tax=Haliangium sp. TaxID=2663208 RepID=UPI003D0A4532
MNTLTLSKLGLGLGAAVVALAGCTDTTVRSDVGTAKVRIEAASTNVGEITSVTVEAQGGFTTELTRDGSGAFIGSLVLPAGSNELIGRAFVGAELVGESAPVPVEIQAGFVTGTQIRILDLTGGGDVDHGPIVLALTHPLSTLAGQPVSLSISAVDPDGDALAIQWSDDCDDSEFSDPNAATTDWVKNSAGACRLSVSVQAGALGVSEAASIVVFDQAQAQGGVDIDGRFVSAPQIVITIQDQPNFCDVFPQSSNGTCQFSVAAPERVFAAMFVEWGTAEPGVIEFNDDCGGQFQNIFQDLFTIQGNWLPPVDQSVCQLSARAVSAEGVESRLSAALLVRAGSAPEPPRINFDLNYSTGSCQADSSVGETRCEAPLLAGDIATLSGTVDWGTSQPGFVNIFDTCGGFFQFIEPDPFFPFADWRAPIGVGECGLVVEAFTADGSEFVQAIAILPIDDGGEPPPPPPPPDEVQAFVDLQYGPDFCILEFGQQSVDCPPAPIGQQAFLHADIQWGPTGPGTIELSSSCGQFSGISSDPFVIDAQWLAPILPEPCTLTVLAITPDGQPFAFDLTVPTI